MTDLINSASRRPMFVRVGEHLRETFYEFIAPRLCLLCECRLNGTDLETSKHICFACCETLPAIANHLDVMDRFYQTFGHDQTNVGAVYGRYSTIGSDSPLKLIHHLKYHGYTRLGEELSLQLAELLRRIRRTEYDAIVPVPIHLARRRERGFNQSEIIANTLSRELNIPTNFAVIRRIVYTKTQTRLSQIERVLNVSQAIRPEQKPIDSVVGKRILLVDDVCTTGSTLNVCAEELLNCGARIVDCAVIVVAEIDLSRPNEKLPPLY